MNGGGNISASPDAPQKWVSIPEYEKTIDLEHGRMRVRQRNHQNFVFAGLAGYLGAPNPAVAVLDGDVAYNLGANGRAVRAGQQAVRARRLDMLNNPVVLVRAALDPSARVANVRSERTLQVADITVPTGETVTLAHRRHLRAAGVGPLDGARREPRRRDVPHHVHRLSAGERRDAADGLQHGHRLPRRRAEQAVRRPERRRRIRSTIWRLRPTFDPRRHRPHRRQPSRRRASAQGVWLLHGNGGANSILFEFADHLTMFEAPSSQAWTKALIDRARATVPGKPLTELVVSHHHFDHTGGIRQAIAEGLTIIAHKGTEGLFREIALRKGTIAPDALGANPRPLKFKAVDDHLRLGDATMQVDLYHVVSNSHMAEALFAYVPKDRLLVEGDFFDVGWELYWWQKTYADNIAYRRLPGGDRRAGARARRADRAGDAGHPADDQGRRGCLYAHAGGRRLHARVPGEDTRRDRRRARGAVDFEGSRSCRTRCSWSASPPGSCSGSTVSRSCSDSPARIRKHRSRVSAASPGSSRRSAGRCSSSVCAPGRRRSS